MFWLLTDFNEIEDDRVYGLIENARGPRDIRAGDAVVVHDGGEHAFGIVEAVQGGLVTVEVEWGTFGLPPARIEIVGGAGERIIAEGIAYTGASQPIETEVHDAVLTPHDS